MVVDRVQREKGEVAPAPHPAPPPAPGVAKAAALAEVKSSGTVEVFLRQWGETHVIWNRCGEVTGFYMDLGFRETEEATTRARRKPKSYAQDGPSPWNSLGEERLAWGTQGGGRQGLPSMTGLLNVGGLEGACPLR